jgi:hypothetical protein
MGWRVRAGLVVFLGLMISGCGGRPGGTVTGTVTYQGKRVPAGTVTFFGADDQTPVSVPIDSDGTYTATKVPLGSVKVAVSTPLPPPPEAPGDDKPKRRFGKGKIMPSKVNVVSVPTLYSDPARSGLSLTVKEGSQPFDIKLP